MDSDSATVRNNTIINNGANGVTIRGNAADQLVIENNNWFGNGEGAAARIEAMDEQLRSSERIRVLQGEADVLRTRFDRAMEAVDGLESGAADRVRALAHIGKGELALALESFEAGAARVGLIHQRPVTFPNQAIPRPDHDVLVAGPNRQQSRVGIGYVKDIEKLGVIEMLGMRSRSLSRATDASKSFSIRSSTGVRASDIGSAPVGTSGLWAAGRSRSGSSGAGHALQAGHGQGE